MNINIVFDGPPANQSGRFIEVEDENGRSISVGTWRDRGDGTWALVIEQPDMDWNQYATLCPHGSILCAPCGFIPESWRSLP